MYMQENRVITVTNDFNTTTITTLDLLFEINEHNYNFHLKHQLL